MRAIRLEQTFEIYGDGRQVRDYVHAADVTAAARLGLTDEAWSGPVVIGSGRSLSVLEVIDAVRRVTRATIDVRHGPPRAGEMPAVIVDNSRARAAGWSTRFTLEEGLVGVWEEWSGVDIDAVMSGLGAVGAPAGGAR
jgi:UDP-glucose 4-epimerase